MNEEWIAQVIGFWFGQVQPERWFVRDSSLDLQVRERFSGLHARVARFAVGELDHAAACLAGVIVLDQFPRNMHRNSPRAFATDAQALAHSQYAIERGFDGELAAQQRMFLYMPWQHAEDAVVQAQSVELFERLGLREPAQYAREHQRVIELFGRFPHRNAALGRASTPQELEFLKTHPGF